MAENLGPLDPKKYFRITEEGALGVTYEGRRKAGGIDEPIANGNFLAGAALQLAREIFPTPAYMAQIAMVWDVIQELAHGAEPPLDGARGAAFLDGATHRLPQVALGGVE